LRGEGLVRLAGARAGLSSCWLQVQSPFVRSGNGRRYSHCAT